MPFKASITIEARTPKQRDAFVKLLRGILLQCVGLTVKITTTQTITFESGMEDPDFSPLLSDETPPETPIERLARSA